MTDRTLAENLASEMARLGYNDYSLAMAAGLKADIVRDIKRGKSKHPAADRVDALARVLGRTPAQLLGTDPVSGGADPGCDSPKPGTVSTSVGPSVPKAPSQDFPVDRIDHATELALITLWRVLERRERIDLLATFVAGLNRRP